MPTPAESAFVIMPFQPEFDEMYSKVIEPVLEQSGFMVSRADTLPNQGSIIKDIIRGISRATIVIADLTIGNENVYYELGLCHGLRKPTLLISQELEAIPFDLRSYRILTYSTHFARIEDFKAKLVKFVEEHRNGNVEFGSPIEDFLPSAAPVAATTKAQIMSTEQPGTALPDADEGWLDALVDIEEAFTTINKSVAEMTDKTTSIGSFIQLQTDRLNALGANPTQGSAAQALKIALLVAAKMNDYASSIEEAIPPLDVSVAQINDGFPLLVRSYEAKTPEDIDRISDTRTMFAAMLDALRESLTSVRAYRDTVAEVKGFSKDVTRAGRRVVAALDSFINEMAGIEAALNKTIILIDEMLGRNAG